MKQEKDWQNMDCEKALLVLDEVVDRMIEQYERKREKWSDFIGKPWNVESKRDEVMLVDMMRNYIKKNLQ